MTKWEDLEADAMYAMLGTNDAMEGFEGAMATVNQIHFESFNAAIRGIGRILFMDLVYPIGDKVLPYLNEFANYLSANLPGAIDKTKSTLVAIAPTVLGIVGAFAVFKGAMLAAATYQKSFNAVTKLATSLQYAHRAAMLASTFAGGGFKGMLAGVSNGMKALNLTMLGNPFVLAAVAIAGLAVAFVALYNKSETFRTAVEPLIGMLKTTFMAALTQVGAAFSNIIPVIVSIAQMALPMLLNVVQMVIPTLISIIQTGVPIVIMILQTIATITQTVVIPAFMAILTIVQFVFPYIQIIIQTALTLITGVIQAGMALLQGNWSGAWEIIKSTAVTIMNNIIGFFQGINLYEVGVSIVNGLINGIKSMGSSVLGAITNMIPEPIRAAAGGVMSALGINGYADGGIVSRPELAWIGEGGDTEAVIPWNNSQRSKDLWMATGDALGMWDTSEPESNPFDFDSPDYPFGGGNAGGSSNNGGSVQIIDQRQVIIQGKPDPGQVEREMNQSNKTLLDQLEEEYKDKKRGDFN